MIAPEDARVVYIVFLICCTLDKQDSYLLDYSMALQVSSLSLTLLYGIVWEQNKETSQNETVYSYVCLHYYYLLIIQGLEDSIETQDSAQYLSIRPKHVPSVFRPGERVLLRT